MDNSDKSKPKRSRAVKPLKVALYRNGSHSKIEDESEKSLKTSNSKVGKQKLISPTSLSKTPPLHSSTPKPVRKTVSLPIISASDFEKSGHPLFPKSLVVLLKRLDYVDNISTKAINLKNKPSLVAKRRKSKQKTEAKMKTTSNEAMSPVISRHSTQRSKKEDNSPAKSDGNVTTQIPSEVLENFGISMGTQQAVFSSTSRPLSEHNNFVLSETPPRTSTACSSPHIDGIEQISNGDSMISASGESVLPDSSDNVIVHVTPRKLLEIQTPPISSSVFEKIITPSPNLSSSNQVDPLEMGIQHSVPLGSFDRVTNCDFLYGLTERLHFKPPLCSFGELNFGTADIRQIAPYALKFNNEEDHFLPFVAPISGDGKTFCCLIFGFLDGYMIAYGGYFLVGKDRLFDPIKKAPAVDVVVTNQVLSRQHMSLFNIPNLALLEMGRDDYFPKAIYPYCREPLLSSVEMFKFSVSQVHLKEKVRNDFAKEVEAQCRTHYAIQNVGQNFSSELQTNARVSNVITKLREPRTNYIFFETNLFITRESLKRILENVTPMSVVKAEHGELASLQLECLSDKEICTPYFVAREGYGCTSFYRKAFVLGRIDDHYVVGVIANKDFFIMATKRLYSHPCHPSPGMKAARFHSEMLEMIDIPLWVPIEQAQVMLETRQILRFPHKYVSEFREIANVLEISALQSTTRDLASSEIQSPMEHKKWLRQMLKEHFSSNFSNSLCQFPSDPLSSSNPLLLVECVVKLWVHQLIRIIHDVEEESFDDSINPTKLSLSQFFKLNIDTFISRFLPVFGLSDDCTFQCLRLGPDGLPSAVCIEALPARQIGLHIQQCHTLPLTWNDSEPQKKMHFIPFTLVFQKRSHFPLNENVCDVDTRTWARSVVERWSKKLSYLELLKTIRNADITSTSNHFSNTSVHASNVSQKSVEEEEKFVLQRMSHKRRHVSDEDSVHKCKRRHQNSNSRDSESTRKLLLNGDVAEKMKRRLDG